MHAYWGQKPLAEHWIHTGDLVKISGHRVHFIGRMSSTINVGGYKVNPEVVETVILGIPEVLNVLVSGHKSPLVGAIPKATVVVVQGTNKKTVEGQIRQRCQAQLSDHMIPRLIEFAADIPRNNNQKIMRSN